MGGSYSVLFCLMGLVADLNTDSVFGVNGTDGGLIHHTAGGGGNVLPHIMH